LGKFKKISNNYDGGKCADHEDFGVSKIDHSQDAINHGVAKCDENVDEAEAQAAKG
jgi:hypothetical protein